MFKNEFSHEVIFTHVLNGDMSNESVISKYRDQNIARARLSGYLHDYNTFVSKVIDSIFTADITQEVYQNIAEVLTFWDAIMEARNEQFDLSPNDLYFALLVNFAATRQRIIPRIKSYSGLYSAKAAARENNHNLDYRDYVMNKEGEADFAGDYIKVTIQPRGYNVPFDIEVPVKKVGFKKLGIVKLCTDNVPSRLSFKEDLDGNKYTIPAYLWLNMMKKGVSRFNKVRFSKLEEKNVAQMMDTDHKYIQDILEANDFETLLTIDRDTSFGVDFDKDDGNLIIQHVREVPSLDENDSAEYAGLAWKPVGGQSYKLVSPNFYIVGTKNNAYNILSPR